MFNKVSFIILIIPIMAYSQLDENLLFTDFQTLETEDFRPVTEKDSYNEDIEHESDFYYKPNFHAPHTFVGFPIHSASFYLRENKEIEKIGLLINTDDSVKFYLAIKEKYGMFSTSSISEYYLSNHGFKKPSEYDSFDENMYNNLPLPSFDDCKDLRIVSWSNIGQDKKGNEISIDIYNYPIDGLGFESSQRKLKIIISSENLD